MKRPAGICINCAHVCPPLRSEDPLIKEILLHSATGGQKLYTVPLTVLTGPQFLIFLTSISFSFCLILFLQIQFTAYCGGVQMLITAEG